ncbi:MAG: putative F420-dependent oxidoreductase [Gammaproteobacteria bacterium]|jgi:probable F420-dependent oxidoreductase
MSDPFVSLAAAAAVTSRIKLGTAISLINQHDPIVLAKQVSTLDRLCNGRFIFGVGAGWNVEEMGKHGVEFKERWAQLRERVEAMKALWTQEEATFHGKYVNFDRVWSYPKPVQTPHPPILLGTLGTELGRQRVAEFGDGWIPVTSFFRDVPAAIEDMRNRTVAAGRAADISVSMLFIPLEPPEPPEPPEHKVAEALACNPERVVVSIAALERDAALRAVDDVIALVERIAASG